MLSRAHHSGRKALYQNIHVIHRLFSTPVLEVERKFVCTPSLMDVFACKARSTESIAYRDTYYDDSQYSLTTQDMWLRQRNDTFELKSPSSKNSKGKQGSDSLVGIDFYYESTDMREIAKIISKSTKHVMDGEALFTVQPRKLPIALHNLGFDAFGIFETKRTRHKIDVALSEGSAAVNVDIDHVRFVDPDGPQGGSYVIGEIELLSYENVAVVDDLVSADVMKEVFTALGISAGPVRGKVLEFLHRNRPLHYEALVISGVIGAKLGHPVIHV